MGARRRTVLLVLLALPLVERSPRRSQAAAAGDPRRDTPHLARRHVHDAGRRRRRCRHRRSPGSSCSSRRGRACRRSPAETFAHTASAATASSQRPAASQADVARRAAAAVTGPKSVAVLLFNFSNNRRRSRGHPHTSAASSSTTRTRSTSTSRTRRTASSSLSGDVHGWYTIDATNAGCAYTTWASQARSKATAAGVNLSAYQYVVYAFPRPRAAGGPGSPTFRAPRAGSTAR